MDNIIASRNITAYYNQEHIIVYQAFNNEIANQALRNGKFGDLFDRNRMTWIKTSFLWMMYRSDWGRKSGQERILKIQLERKVFESILSKAVSSKFDKKVYKDQTQWKAALNQTQVIYQWDPDRDINGLALNTKAIQLGLKGNVLHNYVDFGIKNISDFTEDVIKWRNDKRNGTLNVECLPSEMEYPLEKQILDQLGIIRSKSNENG